MYAVTDVEANGLDPDKVWVIVCREVDNPESVHVFERPDLDPTPFREFNKKVTVHIGHNFLSYDARVIKKLVLPELDTSRIIDTLVVSRLVNFKREGGHSIQAWAESHGGKKVGKDITDWSVYTEEMKQRCINDTKENLYVYNKLKKWIFDPRFKSAMRTEHDLELICSTLHDNGFPFDTARATDLVERITQRLAPIDDELKRTFPARAKSIREVTPVLTQKGTLSLKDFRFLGEAPDLTPYNGGPFTRIEFEEFNPASPKQVVERLNEAGWKPTEKTKGHLDFLRTLKGASRWRSKTHRKDTKTSSPIDTAVQEEKLQNYLKYGWKISEENLKTLPDTAPEGARKLVERLVLSSRLSDLEEWLALVDPITGCLHGKFFGIGSWTHRMSHAQPNMANIPVPQDKDNPNELDKFVYAINREMRECFWAGEGQRLIGCDADGIQMRIFAHYVNDPRLTNALVSGSKKDGTDIHSIHRGALGHNLCTSRDDAKTFIYAWLLGAGLGKVAQILNCSMGEARVAVENFLGFYPGLQELKAGKIPEDAFKGYFIGLDGRLVICDSAHLMLAGYLQNGEKIIMSRALIHAVREFERRKLPVIIRNFVHDEHQVSIPDDDDLAVEVSDILIQSIVRQGTELNLNCPLAAQAKFGYTWAETH